MTSRKSKTKKVPAMFRPLLWSLRWADLDLKEDKADIIVNVINEGTLRHWRWIINYYGKNTIRQVLAERLASEFHPESFKLARLLFNLPPLPYARESTNETNRRPIQKTSSV